MAACGVLGRAEGVGVLVQYVDRVFATAQHIFGAQRCDYLGLGGYLPRERGRSKWTFGKLLNYGLDGLLFVNNKPLRIAVYLGMLLIFAAFAYAA